MWLKCSAIVPHHKEVMVVNSAKREGVRGRWISSWSTLREITHTLQLKWCVSIKVPLKFYTPFVSFFIQLFIFYEKNVMRITPTGTHLWSFLPKRSRLLARCSPHSCFPPLTAGLSYVTFIWNRRNLKFPLLQRVREKCFRDCHFPRWFRETRRAIGGQKTKCHANVFICVTAFRQQRES